MPTISFLGKDKVIRHKPPFHFLDKKYSVGDSENMIIHGDNLIALKSLLPKFEGRIKCIYIDPPYNTGNEGWIYNDNVSDPRLQKWIGEVVGKEGEDLTRHDKWLCMMYPRLQLLQKLLRDDGAIFISIDDNEQAALKFICDEIFGANNFVANMIWKNKSGGANDVKNIACDTEYVLVYAKNISLLKLNKDTEATVTTSYNKIDADGRRYSLDRLDKQSLGYQPTLDFPITGPDGKIYIVEHKNPDNKVARWRWSKETVSQRYNELVFKFPYVYTKNYEKTDGVIPRNLLAEERFGRTRTGKTELKNILGNAANFDYPKPTKLIQFFLQLATDKDSIILDSFAGSGTTAHAVINLNKADGGSRRFILIEMMHYAEDITAERVRRVGGEFNFYELGESLFESDFINPKVPLEQLREYIYFMETRKNLPPATGEKFLLGVDNGTAYYYCHEQTMLNFEFLSNIKTRADYYVIYADACNLSEEQLDNYKIIFKQIPYDVPKY